MGEELYEEKSFGQKNCQPRRLGISISIKPGGERRGQDLCYNEVLKEGQHLCRVWRRKKGSSSPSKEVLKEGRHFRQAKRWKKGDSSESIKVIIYLLREMGFST